MRACASFHIAHLGLFTVFACFVVGRPARADELVPPLDPATDPAAACADAAEEGQRQRIAGKLHAARETFAACLRPECPALVQKDCAQFVLELETATPSVVVAAHDGSGGDLTEVRVTVDGVAFLERLDGKAQPIDPGVHQFRFETAGAPPLEKTIVVHEGEKSRVVAVTLQAPETLQSSTTNHAVPVATWLSLGIGAVALGSFTTFGLMARHDYNQLHASWGTDCPQSDVDRVKRKALVADVSLGVSVVSFGIAAWTYFAREKTPAPLKAGTVTVDGGVGKGTGYVMISGTF